MVMAFTGNFQIVLEDQVGDYKTGWFKKHFADNQMIQKRWELLRHPCLWRQHVFDLPFEIISKCHKIDIL
jgi:hypothetical protein